MIPIIAFIGSCVARRKQASREMSDFQSQLLRSAGARWFSAHFPHLCLLCQLTYYTPCPRRWPGRIRLLQIFDVPISALVLGLCSEAARMGPTVFYAPLVQRVSFFFVFFFFFPNSNYRFSKVSILKCFLSKTGILLYQSMLGKTAGIFKQRQNKTETSCLKTPFLKSMREGLFCVISTEIFFNGQSNCCLQKGLKFSQETAVILTTLFA